jgi:hypothetical protein
MGDVKERKQLFVCSEEGKNNYFQMQDAFANLPHAVCRAPHATLTCFDVGEEFVRTTHFESQCLEPI